jgi:DNA topoisomerase-1
MAARKSATKRPRRRRRRPPARQPRRGRGAAKSAEARRRGRSAAPVEDEGPPPAAGTTSLVIVESPAKAKTIGKYLGRGYRVRATVGHIMDLPEKKLGIDIDKGFEPELVPIPGKEKTIADLKSAREGFAAKCSSPPTLIARGGDRLARGGADPAQARRADRARARVLFHEITKDAVQHAIQQAGDDRRQEVEAPTSAESAWTGSSATRPAPSSGRPVQEGDLGGARAEPSRCG